MESNNAIKVSIGSLFANTALAVGKLGAGIWGHSMAMVTDGVHSMSDSLSTLIVIAALRISKKGPDTDHKYGHERFESIAAVLLSVMLAITGYLIGKSGITALISGSYTSAAIPGILPLIAAIVSILVKEFMFRIAYRTGKQEGSDAMIADAWHHRSDALSSIGSLIGIVGARMGFPILEPIATVVICLFILKTSVEIFLSAVKKLTDAACDPDTLHAMEKVITSVDGVQKIDDMKTRRVGNGAYVDVEISANGDLSLREAHAIAQTVHDKIESTFPEVKHCMVHVNPDH